MSARRRPRIDGEIERPTADHLRVAFAADDRRSFPAGSAVLDHALLMRRGPVVWAPAPPMAGVVS